MMNFDKLCDNSVDVLAEHNERLNNMIEDPEGILRGEYSYKELIDTVEGFGDKYTIHNFQKDMYGTVVAFLQNKLGKHYSFYYDEYLYPADLRVSYKDHEIICIDLINKSSRVTNIAGFIDSDRYSLSNNKELLGSENKKLLYIEKAEGNVLLMIPIKLKYRDCFDIKLIKENRRKKIRNLEKEIKTLESNIEKYEAIDKELPLAFKRVEKLMTKYKKENRRQEY